MTTIAEAWQAGIDAVVADNALNRGGFADAIRTELTAGFSNAEATGWIDAIAAELNRLGVINNPTYNNLRSNIIADPVAHAALFDALGTVIGALPETTPARTSGELLELRGIRDAADAAIDRMDVLIAAEPAPAAVRQLVRDILRDGKDLLRQKKQRAKDFINALTGDPDS